MVLLENIAYETTTFAGVKLTINRRCNASSILAAMLQDGQRVIDSLVDRTGSDNTYNPAHAVAPSGLIQFFAVAPPVCLTRCSPTNARNPFATDSP
jgi:hypothetical protein